ncbi:MAG: rhomboid family intramembrane serine protease [Calditrichota bacterium]
MFFPYRDENPSYRPPLITVALISVNVVIYFLTNRGDGYNEIVTTYGFSIDSFLQRPYVLLSSIFLHANLLHLLSNMWFLWLFGDNVEDKYGHLRFLVIYLTAGMLGDITHTAFSLFQSDVPVIGASGGVAGVMGAYVVRFPLARIRCVFLLVFYPLFFRIAAIWLLGGWMVFEFVQAFASVQDNVAHWAHVGGFVYGISWGLRHR